jgi:hypothetical protein
MAAYLPNRGVDLLRLFAAETFLACLYQALNCIILGFVYYDIFH